MSSRFFPVANGFRVGRNWKKNRTAYLAVDPTYGIRPGNPYYVENAIEYLDEPGEWVFDSGKGRVYLWPDRPLGEADIRAPYLQEFIRVEGIEDETPVRHLHFVGLTFRHGLRDTWQPGDRGLQHDWEMYDKGIAAVRFRRVEMQLIEDYGDAVFIRLVRR